MVAAAYGFGGFATFWFFFRPKMTIREMQPAEVKFAGVDD
jgi:hypothetical protein